MLPSCMFFVPPPMIHIYHMYSSLIHLLRGNVFIWRAQVGTTPSGLRKLVEPMREVRKLCASYAQTVREFVVPVRVNVDTDWHAFEYSS